MPGIAEQQRKRSEMLKRDQRRMESIRQRNEFDRIRQEERMRRTAREAMRRRNAQPVRGSISAGERQLMEEMLRQSPPLIRGMNSETRIDMLKPPKFRK